MENILGRVYLVGAGPGDPRLLTLRGAECLRQADVVLYDYLASADLLRFAPDRAELVCLGRHGSGRIMSQDDVNGLMVQHAMAGKSVVRLKGGDPSIFGRLVEETAALAEANISFEVVPGVTAAAAAGAYAGIAVTDRDQASCVAFVAGRERVGKQDGDALDYAALATFPGTLVFYMGVTTAPRWSAALIAGGKPADTPVAVVRHGSQPTQQVWTCTLGEIAERLAPGAIRPPVVVIVGPVAEHRRLTEWFTDRPLFGKTVLVTRAAHQADDLSNKLLDLGATILYQPAIEISHPDDYSAVDHTIERLECFDWLVFSSRNGVEYFFDRLWELGYDWRALAGCQLAAIGSGTAAALAERKLRVDCQPKEYRAEALAEMLAKNAAGQRFLLLRASRGREVLAESLTSAGGAVEQVVVYQSQDVPRAADDIQTAMAEGQIDWVTVTSSSIARSLVTMFGESLSNTRLAAISPLTGGVLRKLGYPPTVEAGQYTMDGLVAALSNCSPTDR